MNWKIFVFASIFWFWQSLEEPRSDRSHYESRKRENEGGNGGSY
jgi:hypothetical protein